MSYSIPPSPPNFKGNTYNPASYPSTNNTGLTVQGGLSYFVAYPQAQGKVTLLDTSITGNLRTSDNIFLDNSGNYIQFPDGTKQTTATQDFSGYAFTDVSNNFSKLNTFNGNIAIGGILNTNYLQFPDGSKQYSAPTDDINTVYNDISNTFLNGTIQTFTGNNNSAGLNSPFVIKNYDNGDSGSLYLDPSGNYDITLFSNQSSNAGLTVRSPSYSFTINPTSGNTASFLNPISSNSSISGNSLITGTSITFPDTTVQTTAFTTSLLSPYAPLSSPVLIGNPTISTTPLNTSLSSITNVNYVNQAVAGSIPVLTNYAQLTYSSPQTFTGQVNFTGGLQKNGLSVATISQLPVITATTLSITDGSCSLNSGSFQQAVQTYYSNSGASLGTFLNYPIVFTINSFVAVGSILAIFTFSVLPYPAFPPTNPNFSITGSNQSGLVMPIDGQFYIEGGKAMFTLFMPYNFGTGNVITINFASLGNLVG
jgi:hypothetical protein